MGVFWASQQSTFPSHNHAGESQSTKTGNVLTPSTNFRARCEAPGVVRCFGFDSPTDITGNWGNNVGTMPNSKGARPDIDTSVKASGRGSTTVAVGSSR